MINVTLYMSLTAIHLLQEGEKVDGFTTTSECSRIPERLRATESALISVTVPSTWVVNSCTTDIEGRLMLTVQEP